MLGGVGGRPRGPRGNRKLKTRRCSNRKLEARKRHAARVGEIFSSWQRACRVCALSWRSWGSVSLEQVIPILVSSSALSHGTAVAEEGERGQKGRRESRICARQPHSAARVQEHM